MLWYAPHLSFSLCPFDLGFWLILLLRKWGQVIFVYICNPMGYLPKK